MIISFFDGVIHAGIGRLINLGWKRQRHGIYSAQLPVAYLRQSHDERSGSWSAIIFGEGSPVMIRHGRGTYHAANDDPCGWWDRHRARMDAKQVRSLSSLPGKKGSLRRHYVENRSQRIRDRGLMWKLKYY